MNGISNMNHKEFNLLYNSYQPALLRYAQLRCGEEAIAKDIVQQIFLKLLEKKEPLRVKNWKAYLFTMARNETVSYLHKEKLHSRYRYQQQQFCGAFTNHDYLVEKEFQKRLKAAIEKLPPKQRLVYELRIEHNWKNEKVAQVLQLSLFTVKKQIQDVRKKLREMVA